MNKLQEDDCSKHFVNMDLAKFIYNTDPRTSLVEFGNALFFVENLVKWQNNGWSLREHRQKFAKFMKEAYSDDRFEQLLKKEADLK
jgi:hypothetical protein